jgi:hypothetical protein
MPLLLSAAEKFGRQTWGIFFESAVCRQTHFSDLRRRFETRRPPGQPGWFTEGFDTRDSKEAKALLAELA